MDFEKSFIAHIQSSKLIPEDSSVLIAVSGGRDSIALLYLLYTLQNTLKLDLYAGHVNHRLRKASDSDAAFVQKQCEEWGISFLSETLNPVDRDKAQSLEAWARDERYKALNEMLLSIGGDCIATAHHANDQAETILFRLQQKSGLDGLRGIHEKRGNIIRPFLPFKRNDIDDYIQENNISFIEDATNADTTFPRNFIRHEILKPWEDQDAGLIDSLVHIGEDSAKLLQFMNQVISEFIGSHVDSVDAGTFTFHSESFKSLPDLIQARIIKTLTGDSDVPWRRHQWLELSDFLKSAETGDILEILSEFRVLRDRDYWILSNQKPAKFECQLNPGEPMVINNKRIVWDWAPVQSTFSTSPNQETIDGGFLENKLVLIRNWKPGDRFQPIGMKHSKKLSDFLTDEKLNRFEKENQLVVEAGNDIVWVCGLRISEKVKVTPESSLCASLTFESKGVENG